jgi:hypothetical protein
MIQPPPALALFATGAIILTGCGGSSSDQKGACSRVLTEINTFGSNVSSLTATPEDSSTQDRMVADADTFKAALSELRGDVSSQSARSTIDQYTGVLARFEQGIEAASSGNYSAANGDLAGIADEIGGLNKEIQGICK